MWNQKLVAQDPELRTKKILELRGAGITIDSIAKRYSVSVATVMRSCEAAKVEKVRLRRVP